MRRSSCGAALGSSTIRRSISPSGSTGGAHAGATSSSATATITVAESAGRMVGFVTVDPRTLRSRPDRGRAGSLGRRRRGGADRRGQAHLAARPRSARQHRQHPRHPLLREARLCDFRRGAELALRRAGPQDELAAELESAQRRRCSARSLRRAGGQGLSTQRRVRTPPRACARDARRELPAEMRRFTSPGSSGAPRPGEAGEARRRGRSRSNTPCRCRGFRA